MDAKEAVAVVILIIAAFFNQIAELLLRLYRWLIKAG